MNSATESKSKELIEKEINVIADRLHNDFTIADRTEILDGVHRSLRTKLNQRAEMSSNQAAEDREQFEYFIKRESQMMP